MSFLLPFRRLPRSVKELHSVEAQDRARLMGYLLSLR